MRGLRPCDACGLLTTLYLSRLDCLRVRAITPIVPGGEATRNRGPLHAQMLRSSLSEIDLWCKRRLVARIVTLVDGTSFIGQENANSFS